MTRSGLPFCRNLLRYLHQTTLIIWWTGYSSKFLMKIFSPVTAVQNFRKTFKRRVKRFWLECIEFLFTYTFIILIRWLLWKLKHMEIHFSSIIIILWRNLHSWMRRNLNLFKIWLTEYAKIKQIGTTINKVHFNYWNSLFISWMKTINAYAKIAI